MTSNSSTDETTPVSQIPAVPKKTVLQHVLQDAIRILPLLAIGIAFIHYSPDIALWFNEPPISAWGLVVGGIFHIIAFSYVARRLLFPAIDMPSLAMVAVTHPIGAAIVFFSVCYVLTAVINIMGMAIQLR